MPESDLTVINLSECPHAQKCGYKRHSIPGSSSRDPPASVEGIGVLHGELTNADETAARATLVAELGLNLIYHKGILCVAVGVVAYKLNRGLLVGHAEHHARVVAVGEAKKLAADALVSARLIPERSGESYREQNLLAADIVHFLADNILDFLRYAAQGEELRIYARWPRSSYSRRAASARGCQ